jgi:uncharacterized protein YoxC
MGVLLIRMSVNNEGAKMSNLFWGLITLSVVVGVIFFIIVMIELRGAIKGLKELVGTTEKSIKPTVMELQHTLQSIRILTDNVTTVTEDIKGFSDSVREVGEGVKRVSENVKQVSGVVENITSSTLGEVSGLKAGIRVGLGVFFKNLFSGK